MERRWRGRAARQRRVAMIGGAKRRRQESRLYNGPWALRVLGFRCSPVPIHWRFPGMPLK